MIKVDSDFCIHFRKTWWLFEATLPDKEHKQPNFEFSGSLLSVFLHRAVHPSVNNEYNNKYEVSDVQYY